MERTQTATSGAVLVTGGSRGLGRGVCVELARRGYSVGINYNRNLSAAEETAALCAQAAESAGFLDRSVGGAFVPLKGNVASAQERSNLVAESFARFGTLIGLVNNAGIGPSERRDILDASENSFREVLSTNLEGPYFLTQEVVRRWLKEPVGRRGVKRIVFVGSISATTVSTNRGEYCVSKAGLAMANQLWAARLGEEDIISVELRPGIMKTDMTAGVQEKYDTLISEGLVPQKRWGTAEDVGRATAAILNGDFDFSSGSAIDIDGGFHIARL